MKALEFRTKIKDRKIDLSDEQLDLLSGKDVRVIVLIEELEESSYAPAFIQYDNITFILATPLNSTLKYEDGHYIIRNETIDLSVWGDTRSEAEDAFSFSFYSLYLNYYKELDEKLSPNAQNLKQKLHSIIKQIIEE